MLKDTAHNQLIIRIQPDEALHLKMNAKMPGLELRTISTKLDLSYQRTVPNPDIPEAYESLLLDAFKGDYSDSVSEQELEASWKIFTPLLHHLERDKDIRPVDYAYGMKHSWLGSLLKLTEADRIGRSGRAWKLCRFLSVPEMSGLDASVLSGAPLLTRLLHKTISSADKAPKPRG